MTGAPASTATAPRGVLIITGTGTGVGKTVVTAAIAALALARGARVAVVKPAQTGIADQAPAPAGERPDAETVRRLSGVTDLHELARFPDPLSPEAAARVSGRPPLDLAGAAETIARLADSRDLVLVEGAGGLLVRYDAAGATIADLAARLAAPVLVVTAAGLGTLNHTALTLEAIAARKLRLAGVVIGAWPRDPDLAERENRTDLETIAGGPLAGLLPAGSGSLSPDEFRTVARPGLGRSLGGVRGARDRLPPGNLGLLIVNGPVLRPALRTPVNEIDGHPASSCARPPSRNQPPPSVTDAAQSRPRPVSTQSATEKGRAYARLPVHIPRPARLRSHPWREGNLGS